MKPLRKHLLIPDTQIRSGVPLDHMRWIGYAIVEYMPDVIVHLGDHWDFPSLSGHDAPGSAPTRDQDVERDIAIGNEAFNILVGPMRYEMDRRKRRHRERWEPECHFLFGNHEHRLRRYVDANPKLAGILDDHLLETPGFRRHPFLQRVWIDGIGYSHFWQNMLSSHSIGGSIENRLNKIGHSFVQGHEQGFKYATKDYPTGMARHGLVAGSSYLHFENYKGRQTNNHWRGIVILNEVEDGNYCVMALTLRYLCRKYEKMDLVPFMQKCYPQGYWEHLYYPARYDEGRMSG
jgi:hypothetical protein